MASLDLYESGLGYRALRIETCGEEDIRKLSQLFDLADAGATFTNTTITLNVAIRYSPPWRIKEDPAGVATWTLSPTQREEVLRRIQLAQMRPSKEILLNEEYEDLVVELVHQR